MAKGWVSPWQYQAGDHLDRRVTVSITFNNSTLAITNPALRGVRDPGCLYDRVLIGRPDGSMKVFRIPEGSFSVSRTSLLGQGFATIQQVVDANFTLGTTEE